MKYWSPGPRSDQFHHRCCGISSRRRALGILVLKLPRWFKCLRALKEGKKSVWERASMVCVCVCTNTWRFVYLQGQNKDWEVGRIFHFLNSSNHSIKNIFPSFLLSSRPSSFPRRRGLWNDPVQLFQFVATKLVIKWVKWIGEGQLKSSNSYPGI